jgi:CheY-like chemotaxis protein/nitrogen-specific signal transduction histidine kinase
VRERTAQLELSNEELKQATDVAEKANRAKSEFLSSMSHELRTPLNAIIGFGQLLGSDIGDTRPERRREFAEHIVGAGKHLLTLINEILNLARIESGHVELSLEPVLVDDVLAQCRQMIEPLAQQRGIALQFDAGCDAVVMADRMRLKQVLLNLVSNAIKYNRPDGSVRVSCSEPGAGAVRLSVRDTGRGLTPAQVESLFQPFNRLGQEGGPEQGTGIGLVVTQRLVELMGGRIGVHSMPGEGSVFWIDLQASERPVLARAETDWGDLDELTAPREAPAPATVLYVEDNPASLRLVQELLQSRGDLRLLSATDGRTGVQMAREHQPDVILMDNNMPTLSGRDAQAILKRDPRTAHIPVIALTANAMPDAAAAGLAAGFYRYLTKPLNPARLMEALDSALKAARERR